MAENLPVNFAIPGENVINSYDFIEAITGQGYVEFYNGYIDSGLLTQNAYYSKTRYTSYSQGTTGSYVEKGTIDFKILVNKPLTVQGKAIFTIPTWKGGTSGGGVYVVCSIGKDDGTVSILASGTSNVNGVDASITWKYLTAEANVPKTNFNIGEYIVVRWVVYQISGQNTGEIMVGHDPKSPTDSVWTSTDVLRDAKTLIPIKVDL